MAAFKGVLFNDPDSKALCISQELICDAATEHAFYPGCSMAAYDNRLISSGTRLFQNAPGNIVLVAELQGYARQIKASFGENVARLRQHRALQFPLISGPRILVISQLRAQSGLRDGIL